jgi:type VI secretion system secreted protein Hcp
VKKAATSACAPVIAAGQSTLAQRRAVRARCPIGGDPMPEMKPKASLASRFARPLLAGAAAGAAMAAPQFSIAADIFLKLATIEGDSTDEKFKGQIDVLSYTQSVRNSGTTAPGGGGGAGKVSFGAVTVLKNIDRSSPELIQAIATGKHITEAVLSFRTTGANPVVYYTIKLTDVLITALDQTDNPDPGKIVEKLSLTASKYEFKYTPIDPQTGKPGTSIEFGWDVKQNQKF